MLTSADVRSSSLRWGVYRDSELILWYYDSMHDSWLWCVWSPSPRPEWAAPGCLARPEPSRDTRFQTDTHNYQGECQISRVSYYTTCMGKFKSRNYNVKYCVFWQDFSHFSSNFWARRFARQWLVRAEVQGGIIIMAKVPNYGQHSL